MSNNSLPKGAPASALTEYRKNRMIYANYLIQQQDVTNGCIATMGLETPGGVAPGSIIPTLKTGALFTSVAERDLIVETSACHPPAATGTIVFRDIGTFTWIAPARVFYVQYLVVAGGGGSGGGYDTGAGAGGGGGMVLIGTLDVIPGTTYTIAVGDGGDGGITNRIVPSETPGASGGNSTFGSVTALGGGGGWPSRQPSGSVNGNGGAAAVNSSIASLGGNGGGSNGGGGGGGGSSGAGGNRSGTTGGAGGAGTANSLSGTSVTYGVGGAGGTGGTTNAAVAGTANTGNGARGGGGASGAQSNGAKGGSGIVVLSY